MFLALGSANADDEKIRAELVQMADDFVNLRMMQGFDHEMSLAEAYRWQDEMVRIMEPALGGVVGYKTGGHDPGPGFATFPPEGVRAYILEGMLREDGTAVRVNESKVGFLEADFAFRVGDASINQATTDLPGWMRSSRSLKFRIPITTPIPDRSTARSSQTWGRACRSPALL